MTKKQKERRVDFSQDEMIRKSKIESRTKFTNILKRICEMYDINLLDFKLDEKNEKSGFFFSAECSELLALLIRNHIDNPLARKNPDKSKITATSIAKYNSLMIEDIDNEVDNLFRKLVYTMPAHMVSQEIADWAEPLVKQLTYFLINITTLGNENVGEALSLFTKKLDEINYCLYRGNYIVQKVENYNFDEFKDEYDDVSLEIRKLLNKQNLSIDKLIANMLKYFDVDAKNIRHNDFPDLLDILKKQNYMYRFWGIEKKLINKETCNELFEDNIDPSDEELRVAYYSLMIEPSLNEGKFKNNEFVINHYREKVAEWKQITDKIISGEFKEPCEQSIKEKKEVLKENIQMLENQLLEHKEELKRLEQLKTDELENDLLVEDIKKNYVIHCGNLDKEYKNLYDIVDVFVGQALNEFIK